MEAPSRDGAYIHGLYAEGARWDTNTNTLEDALMKQLYPPLPVVLVKSAMQSVRARPPALQPNPLPRPWPRAGRRRSLARSSVKKCVCVPLSRNVLAV